MNLCRDCKHWQSTGADAYTDNQTGHQHASCQELTHSAPDFIYFSDYQTYDQATMVTREDFGCIRWTPGP